MFRVTFRRIQYYDYIIYESNPYKISEEKDVEAAKVALKEAISVINKAGSKGVYHKNTCARKISRLTKAVNEIA